MWTDTLKALFNNVSTTYHYKNLFPYKENEQNFYFRNQPVILQTTKITLNMKVTHYLACLLKQHTSAGPCSVTVLMWLTLSALLNSHEGHKHSLTSPPFSSCLRKLSLRPHAHCTTTQTSSKMTCGLII